MVEQRIVSVSKIEIGDIAPDGGVATVFAALGGTYKDTAYFRQEEGEDIEHEIEESDDPTEVMPGAKKSNLAWGIINFAPDVLVKVLGGKVTGTAPDDKWEAPETSEIIEKSVKFTPKKGKPFTFPRVSIKAVIDYEAARAGIAKVLITGKVLTPTKSGVAPFTIG